MRIQERAETGAGVLDGRGTGPRVREVLARAAEGPAGGCGRDPAARRRTALFAPLLRTLRGITRGRAADTAALLGRCRAEISRMESGQRGISMRDLEALLAGYGYDGAEYRSLMGAAHTPFRDWWTGRRVLEGDFRVTALLELAAARILVWQPAGVPELVQVPAWARLAAEWNPRVAAGDAVRYASAPAARQEAVLRGPYPARLEAILGRPVPASLAPGPAAGRPGISAFLAAEQGQALKDPPPGVRVRYPSEAGSWLPASGPFTILTFGSGPVPALVHLPGPGGGVLVSDPRTVSAYIAVFQDLDDSAAEDPRPAARA